jgi:lipopolysaccharide export system permease protein
LNYIAKQFGKLVGKGLSWDVIVEFFILSVPFVIAMTLPMAVLIATLYAFSRIAADSEVTALMACGVGPRRLMVPGLIMGAFLSMLMVAFNDQILPRANHRLSSLQASISQKKPTLALKAQTLNEVSNAGLYMWLAQLDQSNNTMKGVTIYDLSDASTRHTIVADSGHLAFASNQRDLILTLFDGYVEETQGEQPDRFQRTFFTSNVLRVADVANQLVIDTEGGYKGDREMTVCEMQGEISRTRVSRDSLIQSLAALDAQAAGAYRERYGSRTGQWYCAAMSKVLIPGFQKIFVPKAVAAQSVPQSPPQSVPQSPPQSVPQDTFQRIKPVIGAQVPHPIPTEAIILSVKSAEKRISQFDVETRSASAWLSSRSTTSD